jgi:hypothetical protein
MLAIGLSVVVLGAALAVITIVMLVAAGVPAPWEPAARPRPSSSLPTPPATYPAAPTTDPAPAASDLARSTDWAATGIAGDGTYLVGTDLRPGRYLSDGGANCQWARLAGPAGVRRVLVEGNGTGRTTVTIRETDTGFRTAGCGAWIHR